MKRQNARHFAHNNNGRYMEHEAFLGKYDCRRSDDEDEDNCDEVVNIELQLNKGTQPLRHKNYLEAEIQKGDTLQAIAIRFNCSVADLKRINKIEREYEIHARKTLRVPLTIDTVLLEHLPIVHKSGQCSPKQKNEKLHNSIDHKNCIPTSIISTSSPTESSSVLHANHISSQLPNKYLNEKLMVAAVSFSPPSANQETSTTFHQPQSSARSSSLNREPTINDIILQSQISSKQYKDYDKNETTLLTNSGFDDNRSTVDDLLLPETQPRSIPSRGMKTDLSCSGSDCDMSWVVLFICILALCFAIPLIYVIYIAEHPEHHHHIF